MGECAGTGLALAALGGIEELAKASIGEVDMVACDISQSHRTLLETH